MPSRNFPLSDVLITCHVNPDFDAVASLVAAEKLYPGAAIVLPGGKPRHLNNELVERLLGGLNLVKAKDMDFRTVRTLVAVDTRSPERLGLVAPVLTASPKLAIHLYDHHPDAEGDLAGEVSRVDIVGATVTILTEILREKGIALSPDEATLLALGLYEDTGNFTYFSTTPRDLAVARHLLESGADLKTVASVSSREMSVEQISLLNELIGAVESREIRGKALAIAMASRERHIDDVAVLAPKMLEVLDLDTLFILVQMENLVQMVARSKKGGFDVGKIAQALGGGGHQGAAAAALKGLSLDESRRALEDVLRDYVGALFAAGNVMVHPPLCVAETEPLSEAMDMMSRYGLHVLLAEDREGKVSGIVTERSVTKAIYHGLTSYPVKEFMQSDFVTASLDTSFYDIQKIIVEHRQRILPVVDQEGKALGVITRTDLLHVLASEAGGEEGKTSSKTPFDRNLAAMMESRLSAPAFALLREMGEIAAKMGVSLYLVGGTVRDLIMLKPIHDLDFTVTGELSGFTRALVKARPGGELRTHPRFKTATLILPEGYKLDFSSARVEYYEYPGALPVVRRASIQLDLQRRDFTVNTLAIGLNPAEFGKLLDYYRGYQDIRDGLIRVLHSLSFVEDPTRAFRAVRFENRLGFRISRMTANLISGAVAGGFLKNLSARRILAEIKLTCQEDEPGSAFERLGAFGLLKSVDPNLKIGKKHLELFRKVDRVRDWYRLTFSSRFSPLWLVYFLALTFELDQESLYRLSDNMEESRKMVRALISERPFLERVIAANKKNESDAPILPSEADEVFGNVSWPGVLYIMARVGTGPMARAGASFLTTYRRVKSELDGDDLISMGFAPGPALREALESLRKARLDGVIRGVEAEREYVKKLLSGGSLEG
ncbi:MAG: CBS domain-containing protein [Deltaproteobacteria bacterium]|jgi:tRNA nucleotidyltransferase (CCA-adding enzyme)|nr:CBS domain-containing protein [Deltaproteobacteria bacterium]